MSLSWIEVDLDRAIVGLSQGVCACAASVRESSDPSRLLGCASRHRNRVGIGADVLFFSSIFNHVHLFSSIFHRFSCCFGFARHLSQTSASNPQVQIFSQGANSDPYVTRMLLLINY